MSELTRCNRCKLEDIERKATARGATVTLGTTDDMPGWIAVKVSDQDRASAWFLELPLECAC